MPDTAQYQALSAIELAEDEAMDALNSELSFHWSAIQFGQSADSVERLVAFLAEMWDAATATGRVSEVATAIRKHPIMQVLLLDPFTRRSFDKPRGYAGDAVMLDFIYRPQPDRLAGIARAIYEGTTKSSTGRSILWRQHYLANLIARTAVTNRKARILSVASGHIRELDAILSLLTNTQIEFTCLDSDADSLTEACREQRGVKFQPLNWSVVRLLKTRDMQKQFALIYSAGLCDYLSDRVLVSLIRTLHRHIEPGGILSLANFTPEAKGRGYLEFCMNWRLIYRTEDEMTALVATALPGIRPRMFHDGEGGVVYAEIAA